MIFRFYAPCLRRFGADFIANLQIGKISSNLQKKHAFLSDPNLRAEKISC